MKTKVKVKNNYIFAIVITTLAFLAAFLITGIIIINGNSQTNRNALENNYQRSMYLMTDSVNNLEVNLSKVMVAGNTEESLHLLSDTASLAELSEASLSTLPLSRENTVQASKYFNQVNDWCKSYASAIINCEDTEVFSEQAETLYITARNINMNIKELNDEMRGKSIISSIGNHKIITNDFDVSFSDIGNSNTVNYPELIYDGPFSDGKKYSYYTLEGLNEITAEQAVKIASDTFSLSNPYLLGETHGKTDIYQVMGTFDGIESLVSVTKDGGIIICYDRYRPIGAVEVEKEAAYDFAVKFVSALGYKNLQPVWYSHNEGLGYVNLAPVIDDVTIYTDLVKVSVALDDGEVLSMEATGYCSKSHKRNLKATISENTARSLVSKKINIERVSLAVVPDGENEKLCYEVYGTYKGLEYFVYIDSYNGKQVNILRVIDNDQGELVM